MNKLAVSLLCMIIVASKGLPQSTGQDLSGAWSFTVMEGSWKVELIRDKSKESGDDALSKDYPVYCGTAKTEDKNGPSTKPEICAFEDVKEKKLNLYISVIACNAPFKPNGTMDGQCIFASTQKGMFRATRVRD